MTAIPQTTSVLKEGELALLTIGKAAWDNNKAAIVADIQKAEDGGEAVLVNALKNVKPGGIIGLAWPYAESAIVAAVKNGLATYGSSYIYDVIDAVFAHEIAVLSA